jgi:hypothetical protein
MNRRDFVKTLVAPAFIIPLARPGERGAGEKSLYLISGQPEKYVPLLLAELRRLGLIETKPIRLRSARMEAPEMPSFTVLLDGRVIDLRRSELASLWRRMQSESPSDRLTVVDLCRPQSSIRQGTEAVIKVDGQIIDRIPLSDSGTRNYPARGGQVSVRISQSAARVVSSTCARKICLSSPPVCAAGERIICAPNRFIMEIPGRGDWDTTIG